MEVVGPENVYTAKQAEAVSGHVSQHFNNPATEGRLNGSEIAHARNFFEPKADIHTLAHAVAPPLASAEHTSAIAMKAASDAISPMLQIIMRLPGHVGIFSSFLECLKSLFMPHDLLASFNPAHIASGIGHSVSLAHLGHAMPSLTQPHAFDPSLLSSSAHTLHAFSSDIAGNIHLHVSASEALKHSMNVSAGVDFNNPQFEGLTGAAAHQASSSLVGKFSGSGDTLAGPSISAQSITPKLSPAERIFSSRYFESASNIHSHTHTNNLLALNSASTTSSVTNTAASTNTSNPNQTLPVTNSIKTTNTQAAIEQIATKNPASLSGMHAKALTLNDVLHKGYMPGHNIPKNLSNNPFANLASNTKHVFQSSIADKTTINSAAHHVKTSDGVGKIAQNQQISHTSSHNHLANGVIDSGKINGSSTAQYTVKSGDNLWKISKDVYGSGEKWTDIYNLNIGTIGANPSLIFSGQKLAFSGAHTNIIQPQHHIHQAESQLAQHNQTNSSIVKHDQEQLARHANPTSTVVSHSTVKPIVPIVANAHLHAPIHGQSQGLTIENGHDHLLSGSGGAQAATNVPSVINKNLAPNIAAKEKSVVSFSLTPDLSFLDSHK